jgi:hypothetical protein
VVILWGLVVNWTDGEVGEYVSIRCRQVTEAGGVGYIRMRGEEG